MLTESVSDPRRANWLTITSMCEDLCWPEEQPATRPNWELEAEILRLTTRLMMRERELHQAKSQLKCQASRQQLQADSWRARMEEKEEQMKELLLQKDAEMQNIVSQLLLFEAELRREQSRIEDLLSEKEAKIQQQKREIERLTKYSLEDESRIGEEKTKMDIDRLKKNYCLEEESRIKEKETQKKDIDRLKKRHYSFQDESRIAEEDTKKDIGRLKKNYNLEESRTEDFLRECKRMDFKNSDSKTSFQENVGVSAAELRREQSRIEDLLDARTQCNKIDFDLLKSRGTSEDYGAAGSVEDFLESRKPKKELRRLKNSDSKNSNSSEDSGVVISSSESCPSPSEMRDELNDHFFRVYQDGVFDEYDSHFAVQKLKDGLGKIRAIQDVTNVKSSDFLNDYAMQDKKRFPYRAPQKMKDLKAKRSINPHKIHRHVASDLNNQVIL